MAQAPVLGELLLQGHVGAAAASPEGMEALRRGGTSCDNALLGKASPSAVDAGPAEDVGGEN